MVVVDQHRSEPAVSAIRGVTVVCREAAAAVTSVRNLISIDRLKVPVIAL